MSQYCLFC